MTPSQITTTEPDGTRWTPRSVWGTVLSFDSVDFMLSWRGGGAVSGVATDSRQGSAIENLVSEAISQVLVLLSSRTLRFCPCFTHISHFLGLTAVKGGWVPLHQLTAASFLTYLLRTFPRVHFSPANLANERRSETHGVLHYMI